MEKVITPTIGRKIWFFPATEDVRDQTTGKGLVWKYGDQPMDASVVFVHGDRTVNVALFDHAGMHHVWPSVHLVQPGDELPAPGHRYCTWMPYQKGQAAKEDLATQENGIGWAVKQMRNGMSVRRRGWNGKGMYIYLGSLSTYDAHVVMRTANGGLVPWLCSQTDLLATDWELSSA